MPPVLLLLPSIRAGCDKDWQCCPCKHWKIFVVVSGHGLGVCFVQQKGHDTLEQTRDEFRELRSLYA